MTKRKVPEDAKALNENLEASGIGRSLNIFMPINLAEFNGVTATMTTEQVGAWMRLIAHAWVNEGRITAEDRKLSRLLGVSEKRWKEIAPEVVEQFERDGEWYVSPYVAREKTRAAESKEKKRKAGREGGLAAQRRRLEALGCSSDAQAMLDHNTPCDVNVPVSVTVTVPLSVEDNHQGDGFSSRVHAREGAVIPFVVGGGNA